MSENKVYEITRMMNDKSTIQNDMNEAMQLVQNMFKERYVSKFNEVITNHQVKTQHSPSKEVNLMQAFKAFMPPDQHEKMEQLINTMHLMDTMNSIKTEYSTVSTQMLEQSPASPVDADTSIHEDGIYDVDSKCVLNKRASKNSMLPIIMMMAMLS